MQLTRLRIENFRNLEFQELDTASDLVVFQGSNGSGKTSLLEAIYLVARGHSFRSNQLDYVVAEGTEKLTCFAEITQSAGWAQAENFDRFSIAEPSASFGAMTTRIGIVRNRETKETSIRRDGQNVKSLSELARVLPLLLITPHTFAMLEGGPAFRRRVLDWGVFHVEQSFKEVWQQWRRVHQQRNVLLKNGKVSDSELTVWNRQYAQISEALTHFRESYSQKWIDSISIALDKLEVLKNLPSPVNFQFYPGFSNDRPLFEQLQDNRETERKVGYGLIGPHKADIRIKCGRISAKEVLSRGQQKLLVAQMLLAQIEHYGQQQAHNRSIVLFDDIAAELDSENQLILLKRLLSAGAQVFCTVIEADTAVSVIENVRSDFSTRMFHVKQGALKIACSPTTPF